MFMCHLFNYIDLIDEVGVIRLVIWSQVKELCSFTDLGNAWRILLNCYSIVLLSEIDTISSSFITTVHRRLICKQVLFWLNLERFGKVDLYFTIRVINTSELVCRTTYFF